MELTRALNPDLNLSWHRSRVLSAWPMDHLLDYARFTALLHGPALLAAFYGFPSAFFGFHHNTDLPTLALRLSLFSHALSCLTLALWLRLNAPLESSPLWEPSLDGPT